MKKLLLFFCAAVSALAQQIGGGGTGGSGTVTTVSGDAHITVSNPTGPTVGLNWAGVSGDYSFSQLSGLIALSQLDPAIAVWQSGAGAPAGSCTAGKNIYLDTTNLDLWFCSATNTYRKALSTANSGAFVLTGQTGTTPATPSTGQVSFYLNSTTKALKSVNDAGAETDYTNPTQLSGLAAATIKTRNCATFAFDGQGSAIANNTISEVGEVSTAMTITGYNVHVDTGTITIDVLKATNVNGTPTFATITSSQTPAVASGTNFRSTTVNLWTSPSATDLLEAKVTAVTGATKASLVVECTQ